jgi:hypothetical protein
MVSLFVASPKVTSKAKVRVVIGVLNTNMLF